MSTTLTGRTIALAEGRQLEELVQLLEREGATTLRYPLLNILDSPHTADVQDWLEDFLAERFGLIVLMTGEAWYRLRAFAERSGALKQLLEVAGRTRLLCRGPKPVRALKADGLAATWIASAPTTEGVLATLRTIPLAGLHVGVTLYASPNAPLVEFLQSAGATVATVMPYIYAPASDADKVAELIERLGQGTVDALVFTSSPQVERLLEVARARQSEERLRAGMSKVKIAAVGPLVAEKLREHGLPVDICPEQGWVMKNLVQHIKREL